VVELLQSIKAEGVAMLAIFHHPELVDRLADRVVTLTPPVSAAELLEPIAS
jgi:alpha-D-ribose 1-methylphosphonate 5-triphosphate synthase subunit PhnL